MPSYTYWIEVRHDGLNKYRMIRGKDAHVVRERANAQLAQWDAMWTRLQDRQGRVEAKSEAKQEAANRTEEAKAALATLEGVLAHTLKVNDAINWEGLKDRSPFPEAEPTRAPLPELPAPPNRSDARYQPRLGLLDRLFASRRLRKAQAAEAAFDRDHRDWVKRQEGILAERDSVDKQHSSALAAWKEAREKFLRDQAEKHAHIDGRRQNWLAKEPAAIEEYCDMVLSSSAYPEYFAQEFKLQYVAPTKTLLIDYWLPSLDDIPTLKEVRWVQSREDFSETHLSEKEVQQLYDTLLYQIVLRTIHEIYEADTIEAIQAVILNGLVRFVDRSSGKQVQSCLLSIQAGREQFLEVDLAHVDPKACFRKFKGIGSPQLHGMVAVPPIAKLDREADRFEESIPVTHQLDDTFNVAAMDWADFEHLIRELFQKEFSAPGAEVRVTRASRDHGVDAVVFDPDPLRGGKIVIQAKRYTNLVDVGAVRDLYGTVVNEGATKGILVTTSDFGPDAYQFAAGKPLTLVSGPNLLSLLQKHGHRARIDLRDARRALGLRTSRG